MTKRIPFLSCVDLRAKKIVISSGDFESLKTMLESLRFDGTYVAIATFRRKPSARGNEK